jgi:hypothetical protein
MGTPDVGTMHAYGLRLWRRAQAPAEVRVDTDKLFRLWRNAYECPIHNPTTGQMLRTAVDNWRRTRRYVEQRRNNARISDNHECETNASPVERRVWRDAVEERLIVDLDETIYHCLHYDVLPTEAEQFDVVLVNRSRRCVYVCVELCLECFE